MEAELISSGRYKQVGQFKGFLFLVGMTLIFAIFFYTQFMVDELRREARVSITMNLEHYLFLLENATPFQAFDEIRKIDVPAILSGEDNRPKYWKKIGISQADTSASTQKKLQSMIRRMDRISPPIAIEYSAGYKDYLHYGDSSLIMQLRFMPFISIALIGLFILIGYMGFRNIKDNEQRSVWVGMARETAHQLGTPLSSLLGWMELLRSGQSGQEIYDEMKRDVERLEKITARFSQIGSEIKLNTHDVSEIVKESIRYYKTRIPHSGKTVIMDTEIPEKHILRVNKSLLGWVIENLIRNSLDSLDSGHGTINISLFREGDILIIDIADNGCGIDPKNKRNVFRPGYTTKKRGWGVGLSLSKRIIQDYHGGKLTVKETHPGKGTTMRITLPIQKLQSEAV